MSDVLPVAIEGATTVTAKVPAQTVEVTPERKVPPLAPTTTEQQDLTTAGQRHINVMWESTQRNIALCVTIVVLTVCAYVVSFGQAELRTPAFILLTNVFFLVIGTYFQRTNHTKTGGVGQNETGR